MIIRKILKVFIPTAIRRNLRLWIETEVRKYKSPNMVYGYKDSNGELRMRTRISDTVFFYHPERIQIADNVFIWHYTIIDGTGGLKIDAGSQIGAWVGIFTHSSHVAIRIYGNHYQEVKESEKKGYPVAPVSIGKYVFIGASSKILPGVTIGDGALVSTGSIVTKNIDRFEIVSGNPAEVIGDTRKLDQRYLDDPQLRSWYNDWQKS